MEDAGLSVENIVAVVGNCYYIVVDIPESATRSYSISSAVRSSSSATETAAGAGLTMSSRQAKIELVKKDWLRFITFIKLCLIQLL
jgi:hypothetical protein